MTLYDELLSAAEKINEYALTIEIDNNPAIITNLKRENFRLLKMADDYKTSLLQYETMQRNAMYIERMLFYELLRQKDELFLEKIKPLIGEEDFDWRAKHQMFTDQEISSAMSAVIKKEATV
jgi:hypothetical protein